MTVSSAFATIANSIAGLTISGVTIKDIDEIPQSAKLLTPLLIPQPDNWITDFQCEFQSFGSNGAAAMDFTYSLNYIYLHCPIGAGVATYDIYAGLITKLSAILVAIASNDALTGLVDLKPRIGQIGVIQDPSGNEFWGVMFSLPVLEFAQ